MGAVIAFEDLGALDRLSKGLQGVDFSQLKPNQNLLDEAERLISKLQQRINEVQRSCYELQRRYDSAQDADERDCIRRSLDSLKNSTQRIQQQVDILKRERLSYEDDIAGLRMLCESLRDDATTRLDKIVQAISRGAGLEGASVLTNTGNVTHQAPVDSISASRQPVESNYSFIAALNHPNGLEESVIAMAGVSATAATDALGDVDKLRIGGTIQGYADQIASMSSQELVLVRASLGIKPHMPKTGGTWVDPSGNPCDGPDSTFSGTWSPDRNFAPSQNNPDNLTWGQIEQQYGPIDIRFQNGHPVFSNNLVKGEFKLGEPTGNRSVNYGQMYTQMLDPSSGKSCLSPDLAARATAFMQNRGCDWFQTQSDVQEFLKTEGLTPHDCENGTMQLVPSIVHGNIPHSALISEVGARDDIIKTLSDMAQKHGIILDTMIGDRILPLGKGGVLTSPGDPSKTIARCVGDGRGNIGLTNLCPGPWKVMREGTPHIIEVPTNKVLGVAMAGEPVPKVHIMLPDSKIVSIISFPGQISLGSKL